MIMPVQLKWLKVVRSGCAHASSALKIEQVGLIYLGR